MYVHIIAVLNHSKSGSFISCPRLTSNKTSEQYRSS